MLWVGGKTTAKRKREESHEDGRSVDGTAGFLPQRLPYDALVKEAGRALADGRSVVLDATFLRRADRQAAARQAAAFGSGTIFVECVCPRAIALERLAQRWQSRLERAQEGLRVPQMHALIFTMRKPLPGKTSFLVRSRTVSMW